MRWIHPALRHSLSTWMGPKARKHSPESLERVRKAMLAALGRDGAELNPRLQHRLLHLSDVNALWHARAEMMSVLSRLHGEAKAVDTLKNLTPEFKGLIPQSLMGSPRVGR
jgi:hypothetical protein